jgi:hypothetical protein
VVNKFLQDVDCTLININIINQIFLRKNCVAAELNIEYIDGGDLVEVKLFQGDESECERYYTQLYSKIALEMDCDITFMGKPRKNKDNIIQIDKGDNNA